MPALYNAAAAVIEYLRKVNGMQRPVCYIVGAGEDYGLTFTPGPDDLVIAADGGYARLRQQGIRPQLVVGDFDSLGAAPQGEETVVLPTVKDVTDTWAAVELGLARGYERFELYGCTGGSRFCHTVANLQTAARLAAEGKSCRIHDKTQIITAIAGGQALHFESSCRGFVSVFSYTDRCTGVCLRGLKYPLEDAELTNVFPLGVSNEFIGIPASVSLRSGIALVIWQRQSV